MGPVPETLNGNKYILTMHDDLSKFSIAVPLSNFESKTTAEALVTNMLRIFGVPKFILSDQGVNIIS